jgi:hypothetical protein
VLRHFIMYSAVAIVSPRQLLGQGLEVPRNPIIRSQAGAQVQRIGSNMTVITRGDTTTWIRKRLVDGHNRVDTITVVFHGETGWRLKPGPPGPIDPQTLAALRLVIAANRQKAVFDSTFPAKRPR